MSRLSVLFCLTGLVFFSGCEAVADRVQERFSSVAPKTKVLPGSARNVFYASQGTLKQMDLQLSRTAEAQGIVNAFSRIRAGDGPREARQYTLEIRLTGLGPAETEVSVLVREQVEGVLSSGAGATNTPLRDHGLYETFFATLRKNLADMSGSPSGDRRS
jgi:hypothetical protein